MARYPKYYVRPDGLHETILRINGKRKAFRGKTDKEVWEKVKAFDREADRDDNSARISRFVFSMGFPDLQSAFPRGCCHLLALLSDV